MAHQYLEINVRFEDQQLYLLVSPQILFCILFEKYFCLLHSHGGIILYFLLGALFFYIIHIYVSNPAQINFLIWSK